MTRNGYFKIDETETHAAVIFPADFARGLSAIGAVRQVLAAGIYGQLQYVAGARRTIPITESGARR